MKFPIEVRFPPILCNSPTTGIRYAIGDGKWVEVPPETTREDLPKWFIWTRYSATQDASSGSWDVTGSTGSKYTVSMRQDAWSCTCAGFGWRRKCKHVAQMKAQQAA